MEHRAVCAHHNGAAAFWRFSQDVEKSGNHETGTDSAL